MTWNFGLFKVAKARHILSLGDKLMSSDRPDTVVVDPGIFSDDSTYSSRSSLGSISLSSSFLSVASLPAGKPLRFTRDVNPEKVKEKLLNKVSIHLRTFIIWLHFVVFMRRVRCTFFQFTDIDCFVLFCLSVFIFWLGKEILVSLRLWWVWRYAVFRRQVKMNENIWLQLLHNLDN